MRLDSKLLTTWWSTGAIFAFFPLFPRIGTSIFAHLVGLQLSLPFLPQHSAVRNGACSAMRILLFLDCRSQLTSWSFPLSLSYHKSFSHFQSVDLGYQGRKGCAWDLSGCLFSWCWPLSVTVGHIWSPLGRWAYGPNGESIWTWKAQLSLKWNSLFY
jgi:hypothetical protein